MDRNVRFLAGGLASLAVASTITLLAPSANAADAPARPCGQPAVAAVYGASTTDPVLRTIPAVTHDEWRWHRELTTVEQEYARVVSAARTETDWSRPVLEHQWSRKVVDRAAVDAVPATDERGHDETVVVTPAVTVTVFEYVQRETGRTRWEDAGWNAETADGDPGKGWTRTGATREDVVTEAVTRQVWIVDRAADPGTPAVAELSHVEYQWSPTAPGPGWNGPLDSRPIGATETTTTNGDEPAGAGWTRTATREVPAVLETVWADQAPAGYAATGSSRRTEGIPEETSETSATAPAGDGWSAIPGSLVVVVDQPETIEVVVPAATEQVQVSPALPASEPCAVSATGGQVVDASAAAAGSTYAEPELLAAPHHAAHTAAQAHHAAAAASPATVLPAAGNPVSPLLLTAGLSGILGGSILVAISRRRRLG